MSNESLMAFNFAATRGGTFISTRPTNCRSIERGIQSWRKAPGHKSHWDSSAIFIFFCHFSVPLKTVHPFRNFLAVLPPPTLYKVETRTKNLDTRVQHCLWGEGRGWTYVNWKMPQKHKGVPRLLSMIVAFPHA